MTYTQKDFNKHRFQIYFYEEISLINFEFEKNTY